MYQCHPPYTPYMTISACKAGYEIAYRAILDDDWLMKRKMKPWPKWQDIVRSSSHHDISAAVNDLSSLKSVMNKASCYSVNMPAEHRIRFSAWNVGIWATDMTIKVRWCHLFHKLTFPRPVRIKLDVRLRWYRSTNKSIQLGMWQMHCNTSR